MLSNGRLRARNIRHVHLVSDELVGRWCLILGLLQIIPRIERVLRLTLGRELDALRNCPLDVVHLHLIVWLVQANVQLARVRSLDVSVRQVPLRLVGLHDTVAMELGHGTFIKARSIETNIEKLT